MVWTKQIMRLIVVMLLQILLFNQLQLAGVCHPYVYVMFLLMMPTTLPHSMEMLIGAAVGLVMDVCCNSLGVHMAACVLVTLLRPYLIEQMVNDKERLTEELNSRSLGIEHMARYTVILVAVHHLAVFLLASWSWTHIGFAIAETLVSSTLTIVLILGYNIVKYR